MKKISLVLFFVAMTAFLAACGGGSTNNDQGTFFNFLSYSEGATTCDDGTNLAGVPFNLSGEGGFGEDPAGATPFGGELTRQGKFLNANAAVGLNLERVRYEYRVFGGSLQIPTTESIVGLFLGPAPGGFDASDPPVIGEDPDAGGGDGGGATGAATDGTTSSTVVSRASLPDAFDGIANCGVVQIPVVPAEIVTFMTLNRGDLPDSPFAMQVCGTALAVSTAGDFVESNARCLEIIVNSEIGIPPTGGDGGL